MSSVTIVVVQMLSLQLAAVGMIFAFVSLLHTFGAFCCLFSFGFVFEELWAIQNKREQMRCCHTERI